MLGLAPLPQARFCAAPHFWEAMGFEPIDDAGITPLTTRAVHGVTPVND
jgi:hypothetical protein